MKRSELRPDPDKVRDWIDRSCQRARDRQRTGVTTTTCKQCGVRFDSPAYLARQFCTSACWNAYRRRNGQVTCVTCGKEFYVPANRAAARKFCSRECMGFRFRKERTCTVCGAKFFIAPRGVARKTCSTQCRNEAVKRGKVGVRNPGYKNGETANRTRWRSQAEKACRRCGSTRRLQLHHVVYEQHVRGHHGDVWAPENSFTICWDCHNGHHRADRRITLAELRPENLAFMGALLGEATPYYLIRYYDVPDPTALLERTYPQAESAA